MSNLVKVDPKEFGLEENKANEIIKQFAPSISECEAATKVYDVIIKKDLTTETCAEASSLRKKLVKVRTGIDKIHKAEKAFYRAGGLFVDEWKKRSQTPIIGMENNLKEIENYFENIEKEKIAKLQEERALEMGKYQDELDYIPDNLGGMPENIWANYLTGVKHSYEVQKEAEKKEEEERIAKEKAEIAEQKRIKKENERLKKEAEERERLTKIEQEKREKAESERLAKEKAEQDKRDKIEAERIKKENSEKLEREKETKRLQDVANAILKKEREEREKAEAELEAKRLEEERIESERLANIETELSKGDSDKIQDLISDLNNLKTKYSFKAAKNKKVYKDVGLLIDKVVEHINQ